MGGAEGDLALSAGYDYLQSLVSGNILSDTKITNRASRFSLLLKYLWKAGSCTGETLLSQPQNARLPSQLRLRWAASGRRRLPPATSVRLIGRSPEPASAPDWRAAPVSVCEVGTFPH